MPAPLPKALRERFAHLIEEGLSGREAARRLQVSAATGARWRRQICASGAAQIAPMGCPPGSGKLAPHVGFFRELLAQDPDITLFELRDALADAEGITVHHSAIAGLLKRLGFTHKKKSLAATERRRAKVRPQRDNWAAYLPPYSPDLNPIEQAFSKLKAHLRRIGARTFTEVFEAIGSICDLYDPTECWNYFKAAGYVST